MWSKILEFILDKDNQRFILFAGLVVALIFGFQQCEKKQEIKQAKENQEKRFEGNLKALTDSVSYYKNKAGEVTAEKRILVTTVENLKLLNENLYTELRKEKDKVLALTQANVEISADTSLAETDTTELGPDYWRFDWSLSKEGDKWERVIQGYTEFRIKNSGIPYNPKTVVVRDLLRMQLITGIKGEKGNKRIFVRSTYPNLQVTKLQGAVIEEPVYVDNPSRFGVGFSLGAGYSPKGFHPYVGIGINYNFIRF